MKVTKFQQGGVAPEEQMQQQGAPMPGEGQPGEGQGQGNPEEQIMAIAQDIIQQMGPEAAAMLAQVIMQILQGGAQQEQPTFQRKGGVLIRK